MLVSIAMTTYNGALYVKQQLRSLVSQTYKNIEIVIVDDCSTDSTIEIIEEFADERIILIKNDSNIGCTL
ncbi:glycosyltransferase, partial [Escherichia coli]|nr:glycosyltransferase [Escherichia coli]